MCHARLSAGINWSSFVKLLHQKDLVLKHYLCCTYCQSNPYHEKRLVCNPFALQIPTEVSSWRILNFCPMISSKDIVGCGEIKLLWSQQQSADWCSGPELDIEHNQKKFESKHTISREIWGFILIRAIKINEVACLRLTGQSNMQLSID